MRKLKSIFNALVILSSVAALSAHATTEESPRRFSQKLMERLSDTGILATPAIDPYDAYLRTLAVYDHFGVPAEADSQAFFDDLQGIPSPARVQSALQYMDFHHVFGQVGRVTSDGIFQVYQDRQSNRVLDYSVKTSSAVSLDTQSAPYREHLLSAAKNPENRPLAGLRIALDPGHMGGDLWDDRTGKFVRDRKGRKLSEGVLALQISMLLEKSLTDLGAQVKITRYSLAPVTNVPFNSFDLRERALVNLRESAQDSWFKSLLAKSSPGPQLFRAFDESSRLKSLFSESQRMDYFILGYDLDARVDVINEFKPDLTLIIHLDAGNVGSDSTGVNPRPHDGTKVYVPGAFFSDEFVSRTDRKYFGRHLLDANAWSDSVKLASSIVHHIHDGLGIGYDKTDSSNSLEIEPGVQVRNLRVQRQLTSQATAYVEGLFYNDPNEFEALLNATHPMMIDGKSYPYSDRLAQLANALNDGVVSFVRSYQ
jgi:N-acetylmuramoyl-L-alanine amidase